MEINIKKQNDWDMPVTPEFEIRPSNRERGEREEKGEKGERGERGEKGASGINEKKGENGTDGSYKTILWWCRQAGRGALLALAALAPIFFLPFTQFPISANKEIFVFGAILIALFAFLGRVLVEGKVRYPSHLLLVALGALSVVWLSSSLFSVNPISSFFGTWSSYESFTAIFLFSILALLITASFDRRDIILSVLLFLGSLAVLGIFEILQLFKIFILPWDFARANVFNPVGSVNELGILIAFGLILTAGFLSSLEISRLLRRFLLVLAAIFLVNLVLINYWVIWTGLALAMAVLIIFFSLGLAQNLKQGTRGLRLVYFQKTWLAVIVLFASLFLLFFLSPLRNFAQTPLEVSPNYRLTLDIVRQNLQSPRFLLGTGPNTFSYSFNLKKPRNVNDTVFWNTNFPQGAASFPNWIVTSGALGALAILFLMGVFIWTGVRTTALKRGSRSIMNVMSQAGFVAVLYMFLIWFLSPTNFTNLLFTFWGVGIFLSSTLFFSYESGEESGRWRELNIFTSPQKTFLFSLVLVVLMAASIAGLYFETERYISENYFSRALTANAAKDNAGTMSNLEKAVGHWKYDEKYHQSLAQATFFQLNDILTRRDLPQETLRTQFQDVTSRAIQAAQRASILDAVNPFNAVLLGSIYENLIPFVAGAGDFAVSNYSKAVSLDPQNPTNYVATARVYIAQADLVGAQIKASGESGDLVQQRNALLAKAESSLTKALELKNDFAPARFLLVQVFDKEGKIVDAINRAFEIVQLNPNDVGSLFQLGFLYYKNGQFSESRVVFERAVTIAPNYSNARYFLGLIYDRQGNRESAITQFVQIETFNSDNQEVKQILVNLRAKKSALFGIVPPAVAPQNRAEAPIQEGARVPVQGLKK